MSYATPFVTRFDLSVSVVAPMTTVSPFMNSPRQKYLDTHTLSGLTTLPDLTITDGS